jgi:hypothetical protein
MSDGDSVAPCAFQLHCSILNLYFVQLKASRYWSRCRYPPVLITTGTKDTRVEWWGPVKFAWRLRANQLAPQNPILLSWGHDGHFCDEPNQVALEKTFLLEHLVEGDEAAPGAHGMGHRPCHGVLSNGSGAPAAA